MCAFKSVILAGKLQQMVLSGEAIWIVQGNLPFFLHFGGFACSYFHPPYLIIPHDYSVISLWISNYHKTIFLNFTGGFK